MVGSAGRLIRGGGEGVVVSTLTGLGLTGAGCCALATPTTTAETPMTTAPSQRTDGILIIHEYRGSAVSGEGVSTRASSSDETGDETGRSADQRPLSRAACRASLARL